MTFFCFLDSDHSLMAHMEPLDAETFEEAQHQATRLLRRHRSARAARIYLDAEEIAVLNAPVADNDRLPRNERIVPSDE